MGASSVTGVGSGSAEGLSQARYSQAIPVSLINGPKVVAAGTVLLNAGTTPTNLPTQLYLPQIEGADFQCQYVVVCNDQADQGAGVLIPGPAYGLYVVDGTDPRRQYINFYGTGGNLVAWSLIQIGASLAQSPTNLVGSGRAAQAPMQWSMG